MDYDKIPSPCYVLDENALLKNLKLMEKVRKESGAQIIVAFKGYAMWSSFKWLRKYLDGATASSAHEARLAFEEMKSRAHTYAAVYFPNDFDNILKYSSHISFNSVNQFHQYYPPLKPIKSIKLVVV